MSWYWDQDRDRDPDRNRCSSRKRYQHQRAESLGEPRTCFSLKEISSDTFQGSWPPLECSRVQSAEHEVFSSRRTTGVLINDTLVRTTSLSWSNCIKYVEEFNVKQRYFISLVFKRCILTLNLPQSNLISRFFLLISIINFPISYIVFHFLSFVFQLWQV